MKQICGFAPTTRGGRWHALYQQDPHSMKALLGLVSLCRGHQAAYYPSADVPSDGEACLHCRSLRPELFAN